MFDFEYHLKNLPEKPGVYIMKNTLGEVIYVGKAKNLKNRVRQYFQSSKAHPEKVKKMVKQIAEFEYIVTHNEVEALMLECNMIKRHSPKYNIRLKDDKFYPLIKITVNEEYPRIMVTRNFVNDGSKYFGPYTDLKALKDVMSVIEEYFPLRSCKKVIRSDREYDKRPCLNYFMKKCAGPCALKIDKEEYLQKVNDVIDLLNGNNNNVIEVMKEEMMEASVNLEFEKAAELRDKIEGCKTIAERQKIINSRFNDEDYINAFMEDNITCVQIFFLRDGRIIDRESFFIENTSGMRKEEVLSDFIKRFYTGAAFIPKNIYVPGVDEEELLEEWLSFRRGKKASIKTALIGEKKKILEMVEENAKVTLDKFGEKGKVDKELTNIALSQLTELLELDEIPKRLEAYDISNIMGMDSVGTMVVFEEGKPKKSDYRRFKIKTIEGADDYGSMREIVRRRFKRGLEEINKLQESEINIEEQKFAFFPDVLLIDGGVGHVNAVSEVLEELGLNIPIAGMVKDDKHRTRGLIYQGKELNMGENTQLKHLITRIQDEVHRYAITYHKTLRSKRTLHSILDDIPNIGKKRKIDLMKQFGSVENIKKASEDELLAVPSMSKKSVESIVEYFHGKR